MFHNHLQIRPLLIYFSCFMEFFFFPHCFTGLCLLLFYVSNCDSIFGTVGLHYSCFSFTRFQVNALLELEKIVSVRSQVVCGWMYKILLEALDGGQKKAYEAKVWVKPWEKFKEVQYLKPIVDGGRKKFRRSVLHGVRVHGRSSRKFSTLGLLVMLQPLRAACF